MIKALCSCGNELNRDGYEKIDIVDDGLLCIEGEAYCDECGNAYKYRDFFKVDYNNPWDTDLEIVSK